MIQGTDDRPEVQHRLDNLEVWVSTSAPGATNDSADTAGIGRRFHVGSLWIKTTATAKLYCCASAAVGAATWA